MLLKCYVVWNDIVRVMSEFLDKYYCRRWERKLFEGFDLDFVNIESPIASNYFNKLYGRQFKGIVYRNVHFTIATAGAAVGRYFSTSFLHNKHGENWF